MYIVQNEKNIIVNSDNVKVFAFLPIEIRNETGEESSPYITFVAAFNSNENSEFTKRCNQELLNLFQNKVLDNKKQTLINIHKILDIDCLILGIYKVEDMDDVIDRFNNNVRNSSLYIMPAFDFNETLKISEVKSKKNYKPEDNHSIKHEPIKNDFFHRTRHL